jgi:ribosomal-protein-alanine N-acetyltransferase
MKQWLKRLFGVAPPSLREARSSDAAAFAAIHAASFRRGWSEEEMTTLLREPAVVAHVAASHRVIRGFILSRKAADEAEILSVAIDPGSRGGGIGARLLDLHLRRLAGLAARRVFLEVDAANEAALRLYARAGFQEVGERPGYYRNGRDAAATALVLRRDL